MIAWIVLKWCEPAQWWEVLDFEYNEGHSGPYATKKEAEAQREASQAWFTEHYPGRNHLLIVSPLEVPT